MATTDVYADTLSEKLTEEELEQRVAILKSLKKHLLIQRDKFMGYLSLLDHEQADIESEDLEKLKKHTEMEKEIVSEIYTLQKVIDPLERMYRNAYPSKQDEILKLQDSLEHIKEQAAVRSEKNQQLLKNRMEGIRNKIQSIKLPFKRSLYGGVEPPSLVDITT